MHNCSKTDKQMQTEELSRRNRDHVVCTSNSILTPYSGVRDVYILGSAAVEERAGGG